MKPEVFQIVDTHCHLHRAEFEEDRDAILERARAQGIVALVDPATDLASSHKIVEEVQQYPEVYGAVGIHPHDAEVLDEATLETFAELAQKDKIVAIGEIGLDYFKEMTPRQIQQQMLAQFLQLAQRLDKPIILHCRQTEHASEESDAGPDAYQDLFALIRENMEPPVKGVLHCFSGTFEQAMEGIALGLKLSFAGVLTFKKADALRDVARQVPFDQVLLETDAPYLAPVPFRGKRNEPAFMRELVKAWTEVLPLTEQDVARVTTVNAHHLFGITAPPERGKIAYAIRNSLYVNLTNACTDRCVFCALSDDDFWKGEGESPFVKGHHLRMQRDPSAQEILDAIGDPSGFDEVVFCGYGEPLIRLEELKTVAKALKDQGVEQIRLNTNGHGDLIHKRSVAPELVGLIDEVSVSLNTPNAEQYVELCRPAFGLETYEAIKAFIREAKTAGLSVVATVVTMPEVDVEACRKIAEEELGVAFRPRTYNDVG